MCTCACEVSVKSSLESEFKWCKVHLSLPSDCFSPLMCMFVCVCRRANALRRKRDLLGEEVGTLHLREPEEVRAPTCAQHPNRHKAVFVKNKTHSLTRTLSPTQTDATFNLQQQVTKRYSAMSLMLSKLENHLRNYSKCLLFTVFQDIQTAAVGGYSVTQHFTQLHSQRCLFR